MGTIRAAILSGIRGPAAALLPLVTQENHAMSQAPKVRLVQEQDYRFAIHYAEGQPPVHGDEPPPLGGGSGPSPAQLLVAAVANCMSDSLLFALRKFKQAPEPITTEGEGRVDRNEAGRLRVQAITVRLHLGVPAATLQHLDRVLDQFEEFCTVGQSVRQGIPVLVEVFDSTGARLK
jgi:organic hydroperoxide reductase OsmC/OhrA